MFCIISKYLKKTSKVAVDLIQNIATNVVETTEDPYKVDSRQDGVKDGHRSGKNQPLSNFCQIMIMLLGVNNEHAFESKCTYFMAGEKRKYVSHEI